MDSSKGSIKVITGPMFSGKTTTLINEARRILAEGNNIQVFKPLIDTWDSKRLVRSHNGLRISAITLESVDEIIGFAKSGISSLAIDEAQFFDNQLIPVCQELARKGYQVIVSGLDLDFRGNPFGPMPYLISIADILVRLTAICGVCHEPAEFTQRLIDNQPATANNPTVLIGGKEFYQPRCYKHFLRPEGISCFDRNLSDIPDILASSHRNSAHHH